MQSNWVGYHHTAFDIMIVMPAHIRSGRDLCVNRRDILKIGGSVIAGTLRVNTAVSQTRAKTKKVIVMGGGIAGLACAYELMKKRHDVVVLEATDRTGGHVRTMHDPLADGLYADVCPATGKSSGACPGYVVDHIKALKRGGADEPSNIQILRQPRPSRTS